MRERSNKDVCSPDNWSVAWQKAKRPFLSLGTYLLSEPVAYSSGLSNWSVSNLDFGQLSFSLICSTEKQSFATFYFGFAWVWLFPFFDHSDPLQCIGSASINTRLHQLSEHTTSGSKTTLGLTVLGENFAQSLRILEEMLSVWSFDDSILVWIQLQLQLWTSVRMEPRRSWWKGWEKSISGELKPVAVASEVSTTLSCTFPPNWMNFQRFSERPINVSSYNTKTVVLSRPPQLAPCPH